MRRADIIRCYCAVDHCSIDIFVAGQELDFLHRHAAVQGIGKCSMAVSMRMYIGDTGTISETPQELPDTMLCKPQIWCFTGYE